MRAARDRAAALDFSGLARRAEDPAPRLCPLWGANPFARLWPPQILTNL